MRGKSVLGCLVVSVLLVLGSPAVWAGRFADVFGMALETDLAGIRVFTVDAGGEAERCGLKVGDKVLRLGDHKVLEGWDLMARIDGMGPEVPLTVGRGEKRLTVALERPRLPGRIVFRSDRSGPCELWRMNADGTDVRQLTRHGLEPRGAVWSPDGKRIAFEWCVPYWDIWIMDENGRNLKQLTRFPDAEVRPRWSPDGKSVYFLSYQWGGTAIGRVNLQMMEQQKVVRISDTPGAAPWRYPIYALSPDGKTLAFPLQTPQGWKLHFANADGTNVRPVPQPGEQIAIDWSPDGHRLLWAEGTTYRYWDLEREKVGEFALQPHGWAMFAPDSRSVVFERQPRDGEKNDIYVADLHGQVVHRLTYHPADDMWADWWAPRG